MLFVCFKLLFRKNFKLREKLPEKEQYKERHTYLYSDSLILNHLSHLFYYLVSYYFLYLIYKIK